MATSELILTAVDRIDPASNAPGTTTTASAAAATTNTAQVRFFTLDVDKDTDETTFFQFPVPANYLSGGTVNIWWIATPTSGNVVLKTSVFVSTASSTDIDTSSAFNAPDLSSTTAVPGTSGQHKLTSIALTAPGLAATRWAVLMVGRDADNAADTAAGDVRIIGVTLTYTS